MSAEKTAFGYIRVSTDIQEKTESFLTQENEILKFVTNNNIKLIPRNESEVFFKDLGISGSGEYFFKRDALQEMLSNLVLVDSIVIYRQDRLTRDHDNWRTIVGICQATNTEIRSIMDPVDLSTIHGQFIGDLFSLIANYERLRTLESIKAGIRRFKEQHGRWGRKKRTFDRKKYLELRKAKISKRGICRLWRTSPATLYRWLEEEGIEE